MAEAIIIGEEAEMAEADAEEHEAENGQADALDVSLGLVRDDGDGGDHADGQRRECGEEPVPIIKRGKIDEQDSQDDDEAVEPLAKKAGGPGKFTVTE